MMEKIAVYAGSFCPFTKGHEDVVRKALPLFDKIVIAVGHNARKQDAFPMEQRLAWIRGIYAQQPQITVLAYEGLTVDLCRTVNAGYMIRGLRNVSDYMAEEEICLVNRQLAADVETLFVPTSPQWRHVSSSLVRELWMLHADYSPYVSYQLPEIV